MDKKFALDNLYKLREELIKKHFSFHQKSIDNNNDVCLNNLAIGESRGYGEARIMLDEVIQKVIDKD